MSTRVAVIGGSGLIGRHISNAISRTPGMSLRVLARRRPTLLPAGATFTYCDITAGAQHVAQALKGCDLVVNAASYVGENPCTQDEVNVKGVAAVARGIKSVGSIPFIHMSTAGVYGTLPFAGGSEQDYRVAPESQLSKSRSRGEAIALDAGASVLRPLFVTGVGDRHFLLPIVKALVVLDAWIDDGQARLSATSAELVAETVVAVAAELLNGHSFPVMHVATTTPTTVQELVQPILSRSGLRLSRSISSALAVELLGMGGVPARKVRQFSSDYYVSSALLHKLLPQVALTSSAVSPTILAWYASHLSVSQPG